VQVAHHLVSAIDVEAASHGVAVAWVGCLLDVAVTSDAIDDDEQELRASRVASFRVGPSVDADDDAAVDSHQRHHHYHHVAPLRSVVAVGTQQDASDSQVVLRVSASPDESSPLEAFQLWFVVAWLHDAVATGDESVVNCLHHWKEEVVPSVAWTDYHHHNPWP